MSVQRSFAAWFIVKVTLNKFPGNPAWFVSYHGHIKRGFSLTLDISSAVCFLPRSDQAGFESYRGEIKLGLNLAVERSSGVCPSLFFTLGSAARGN